MEVRDLSLPNSRSLSFLSPHPYSLTILFCLSHGADRPDNPKVPIREAGPEVNVSQYLRPYFTGSHPLIRIPSLHLNGYCNGINGDQAGTSGSQTLDVTAFE